MDEREVILQKLRENRAAIRIARVPPKTKELFEKLAHDEFCDDYGFTLKFLLDYYLNNELLANILNKIDYLEEEIKSLKNQNVIQLLNGKKIRR